MLIICALAVTLTLKVANQSFCITLKLMTLPHSTKFGNKMFGGLEVTIWTNTDILTLRCDLDPECSNTFLSFFFNKTLWLVMKYHQTKFDFQRMNSSEDVAVIFHTCLLQNCVLRNKNHQNPEHSIIFRSTSANVSPHLWNTSSYQILWENREAIHCAPLLPILRSWERCLPITLDCPPVQSFHNNAANFKVHTSVTFLVNGD